MVCRPNLAEGLYWEYSFIGAQPRLLALSVAFVLQWPRQVIALHCKACKE